MTTFEQTVEAIGSLAAQLHRIRAEAAQIYGPEVDKIISSGCRDVPRIERTLDFLLGCAADGACLELFRRLCRHYWDIDPAATAEHVRAYREMWDSDDTAEQDAKT